MKKWAGISAVLCLLMVADVASARCRKRCAPTICPTTCYAPSCGTGYGQAAGCGYTYVTTYQDVTRTVCEYVPVTTTQDVTETVCTPVKKVVPQTYTYYENVIVNVPAERTVYHCVNETRKAKVAVCKPVTRMVEQTYQVCVPVTKTVKQAYTVCVPVTRAVEQTCYTTVYDKVAVQKTGYHTSYVTTTTCAPVSCGSYASHGRKGCCSKRRSSCGSTCDSGCGEVAYVPQTVCTPVTTPYSYTAYETVARYVAQKQTVNVTEYQHQTQYRDVSYVENTYQAQKQTVPVTTYETSYVEQDVTYSVLKPSVEKYTVQQCQQVAKTRTVNVEYTEYKHSTVVKKVPVTTYQMVNRTVVEKVAVTTCVPVAPAPSYGAPGCGGPVAPAPCCY